MNNLEKQFYEDMVDIYKTASKELNYKPTRFLQLVSNIGGVQATKKLILKEGGTEGFKILYERGRLDLSVEAHVLKPEYRDLFTEEELEICSERLKSFDYAVELK